MKTALFYFILHTFFFLLAGVLIRAFQKLRSYRPSDYAAFGFPLVLADLNNLWKSCRNRFLIFVILYLPTVLFWFFFPLLYKLIRFPSYMFLFFLTIGAFFLIFRALFSLVKSPSGCRKPGLIPVAASVIYFILNVSAYICFLFGTHLA